MMICDPNNVRKRYLITNHHAHQKKFIHFSKSYRHIL